MWVGYAGIVAHALSALHKKILSFSPNFYVSPKYLGRPLWSPNAAIFIACVNSTRIFGCVVLSIGVRELY
jgi:hypothetical protein